MQRKTETHRKIQLGSLMLVAGIDGEADAVLLGVLTLAAAELYGPDGESVRARLAVVGDAAFRAHAEKRRLEKAQYIEA